MAVAFIDLDGLGPVSDAALPKSALLAHVRGDEFTVALGEEDGWLSWPIDARGSWGVVVTMGVAAGPVMAWASPAMASASSQGEAHGGVGVSEAQMNASQANPPGFDMAKEGIPGSSRNALHLSAMRAHQSGGDLTPYTSQSRNTCYYYPSNYAPWYQYRTPLKQYDDYGKTYTWWQSLNTFDQVAYTYADIGGSGIGTGEDLQSIATQQVGEAIQAGGPGLFWPNGVSVTVRFPWHVSGTMGAQGTIAPYFFGESMGSANSYTNYGLIGTQVYNFNSQYTVEQDNVTNVGNPVEYTDNVNTYYGSSVPSITSTDRRVKCSRR